MSRLSRNELIAVFGGLALGVGLFLPWYSTSTNENARVGSCGPNAPNCDVTGFAQHDILRWLLLAAAIAPFVLAYIVLRNKSLSWARGEMTAVVAIAAFGLVLYNGLIDRPGAPKGEIGVELGYWLALLGTIAMMVGAALRSAETERRRKPPGVL